MIVQTSYFDSTKEDVGRFLNYLDKGYGMEDGIGRDVDEIEKTRFAEFADRFNTARMATISPENGNDMSDWEFLTATHRAMQDYTSDRYSLRYMAALHRDTDYDHVQLCMVGQDADIEMDKDDLEDFKECVLDNYNENEIKLTQERLDGKTVEEEADDQKSRISNLAQATLPHPAQEAEQEELDVTLNRISNDDDLSQEVVR